MACAGIVGLVLGVVLAGLSENVFGLFRLWSYGLFFHGVVLLAATAIVWRHLHPVLAIGAALASLGLAAIAVDAFLIEPHWLEVSHRQIASPKIHRPVRIVVVADLQTDDMGTYERAVLRQVLAEKPDIVLFAGDYIEASWQQTQHLLSGLHTALEEGRFAALRGAYAVQGNVDSDRWREAFDRTGIVAVDGRHSFDLGDLRLTCLGLRDSANCGLTIDDARPDQFHLVLGHIPNFAMGKIDADLLVAGHTHGGQVRLPWIGPLMTLSRVPRAWAAGWTELTRGKELFVSRGIGMERGFAPRIRFLCRPELAVIDLVPETGNGHK
jgi:uncharacterized protein